MRAEGESIILSGAALERFAVLFADKVDDNFIAESGGLFLDLFVGVGLSDVFNDVVDVFFGDLNFLFLDLEVL